MLASRLENKFQLQYQSSLYVEDLELEHLDAVVEKERSAVVKCSLVAGVSEEEKALV